MKSGSNDDDRWFVPTYLPGFRVLLVGLPAILATITDIAYWPACVYIFAGVAEVMAVFVKFGPVNEIQPTVKRSVIRWIRILRCVQALFLVIVFIQLGFEWEKVQRIKWR